MALDLLPLQLRPAPALCVQLVNMAQLDLLPLRLRHARRVAPGSMRRAAALAPQSASTLMSANTLLLWAPPAGKYGPVGSTSEAAAMHQLHRWQLPSN